MKIPARPSVACCTAMLIAATPTVAWSASNALVLSDAEPQYASHLCWAAADTLVVNNFYPHCPLPAGTLAPGLFPTSQSADAGYHAYINQGSTLTESLTNSLMDCESNIQNVKCNDFDFPPLRGLTYTTGFPSGTPTTTGSNSKGLTWDAAKKEIDAGRPFLFMWGSTNSTGSSPVGLHQLVATGYSDERDTSGTQWLQIWDPLPVPKIPPSNEPPSGVPACGPLPGVPSSTKHSQWIEFSKYGKPVSDMGTPVRAVHNKDVWDIALPIPSAPDLTVHLATRPIPPPAPPASAGAPARAQASALEAQNFTRALNAALLQTRQIDVQVAGAAPRSLGVPFPIVGLRSDQLMRDQENPTGLLRGSTSAILFPVESQGEVVDAFLMLFMEGRWQRGGYANIEITQRLVEVRARYAAKQHVPLGSFYMVSVPEEVAFFAAHGKGSQAVLIPASTDPLIGAVAGDAAPAEPQLRRLILAIQQDLRRHPVRTK